MYALACGFIHHHATVFEIGGYGIFLVKKNFSFVGYEYEELFGKMANHLTMELPLS